MTENEKMTLRKSFVKRYLAGETMTAEKYGELYEAEEEKFTKENGRIPEVEEIEIPLTEQEQYDMGLEFTYKLYKKATEEAIEANGADEHLNDFARKGCEFFGTELPEVLK